jgi:IS30 family transposase
MAATIGLLGQHFPKQIDFRTIDHNSIQHAIKRLNNRARKTLGFATPNELFSKDINNKKGYRCTYCLNLLTE